MDKLAQLLLTPDTINRLDRIEEGYKVYHSASYILQQLGESSQEMRCFQGKFYRIEERDKTLTISRQDDLSILFTANNFREEGGIIEINQFNLTEQDKERLYESVRYLKHKEKLSQKKRHKGFSIG